MDRQAKIKQIVFHKSWLAAALGAAVAIMMLIAVFEARYDASLRAQNQMIAAENKKSLEKAVQIKEALERAQSEERDLIEKGFGDVNLFQGIQVQIEGVSILGRFFSDDCRHDIAAV